MPQRTLLDMTQTILSAMDSDNVNSIGDTIESMQVAQGIKEVFYELFGNLDIPEQQQLGQLVSLADTTRPNYLLLPENAKECFWIKYNWPQDQSTGATNGGMDDYPQPPTPPNYDGAPINYTDIQLLEPRDFLEIVTQYQQPTEFNTVIQQTDASTGISMWIISNKNPEYWTTFDNQTIIFDSWNSQFESTMQGVNSMTHMQIDPPWQMVDTFIPAIDANKFPALIAEATAYCFANFKQMVNQKAEQQSARQMSRMQNDFWRADQRPMRRVPNFGRRPYSWTVPRRFQGYARSP